MGSTAAANPGAGGNLYASAGNIESDGVFGGGFDFAMTSATKALACWGITGLIAGGGAVIGLALAASETGGSSLLGIGTIAGGGAGAYVFHSACMRP